MKRGDVTGRRKTSGVAVGCPHENPSPRDPNIDHPSVKAYRDTFKLMPNWSYRKDIVVTVDDLDRWKSLLSLWKKRKWNPLKISWLLSEYERQSMNGGRQL